MNLRNKLLLLFLAATLLPLGLTLWIASTLLDQSLAMAPLRELEESSNLLERSGKALHAADTTSNSQRPLLEEMQQSLSSSRDAIEAHRTRNLSRGFFLTLASLASAIWLLSLLALLYFTSRITLPIQNLTNALNQFGSGQRVPLEAHGNDEIAQAIRGFHRMTTQIERSRDKLLFLTRLESWQSLGRKMAHEVKNSLTPIRLTVEEMVARSTSTDRAFLEQASQIVIDEVQTLERRVRAFSDLASEAPLELEDTDVARIIEERITFLSVAHPQIGYRLLVASPDSIASADCDLLKGIVTNLLENAADAVGKQGVIQLSIRSSESQLEILIEDNGPGLSEMARENLFQPTISFKRSGMGLGLSIAKRSAVLMGGDLTLSAGSLPGAAFLLTLPRSESNLWQNESSLSTTKKTSAVRSA